MLLVARGMTGYRLFAHTCVRCPKQCMPRHRLLEHLDEQHARLMLKQPHLLQVYLVDKQQVKWLEGGVKEYVKALKKRNREVG